MYAISGEKSYLFLIVHSQVPLSLSLIEVCTLQEVYCCAHLRAPEPIEREILSVIEGL